MGLVPRYLDPRVDGIHAVWAGDDRNEVKVGDLRQVFGQPRDTQQQVPESRIRGGSQVGGGLVPVSE